jgi:hypothetical protein
MRAMLMALALAVASCAGAGQYTYQPREVNARVAGLKAEDYPEPPGAAHGDVEVMAYGVTRMAPATGARVAPELHVRLIVQNRDDARTWVLDTRRVTVALPGAGETHPAIVTSDHGTPPLLRLMAGEERTVDLYYPLPRPVTSAARLPDFAVRWQIQIGDRAFGQRTTFRRQGGDTDDDDLPEPFPALLMQMDI